jgi:hypothetical protein
MPFTTFSSTRDGSPHVAASSSTVTRSMASAYLDGDEAPRYVARDGRA